jgi:glycosyltransferase involved in cell wall biosynthesis
LSNCTGNKDLVKNDFNGFLFNDKEGAISCIDKFLHDRKLIKRMGLNSRKIVVEKFSLEGTVRMYAQLYDRIKMRFVEINS